MVCTVASLVPFKIDEPNKSGINPGTFPIDASDGNRPVLLVIKGAVRPQYNENYKIIDMPVPAEEVAAAVVGDYILGQLYTSPTEQPAIFWVEGEYKLEEFETKFAKQIKEAKEKQVAWFRKLVKVADDSWQQHHQHRFIADLQRTAAKFLSYKREWLDDSADMVTKCPACMTLISKEAAICYACKCVVNAKKTESFQFAK